MNTNTSVIYHYEQGSRRKAVTLLQPQEQRHSVRAADNTSFETREARRMLQKEKLGRIARLVKHEEGHSRCLEERREIGDLLGHTLLPAPTTRQTQHAVKP